MPITGPQLAVERTLPNGPAEATLMATIPSDVGIVTIANAIPAIPAPNGGTLLLGNARKNAAMNALACTSTVAVSTGTLQ